MIIIQFILKSLNIFSCLANYDFSNSCIFNLCYLFFCSCFSIAAKLGLKANKSYPALSILTGFDSFQSCLHSYLVFISVEWGSAKCNFDVSDLRQLSTAYSYFLLSWSCSQLSMKVIVIGFNGLDSFIYSHLYFT